MVMFIHWQDLRKVRKRWFCQHSTETMIFPDLKPKVLLLLKPCHHNVIGKTVQYYINIISGIQGFSLFCCLTHFKTQPHVCLFFFIFNQTSLRSKVDVKSKLQNNTVVPNQRRRPKVPCELFFYDGGRPQDQNGQLQPSRHCRYETNKLVQLNSIEFSSGLVAFIDLGGYYKNVSKPKKHEHETQDDIVCCRLT